MSRVYNSQEHRSSISLSALLSKSEETQKFAILKPQNLKERLGMQSQPTVKPNNFSLDNLHLFKTLFEKKFNKEDYSKCYSAEMEEGICREVDGWSFERMERRFRKIVRSSTMLEIQG
jgi:hypothetical protein